jgi:DNA-binding NarL/FixJ family response regulator
MPPIRIRILIADDHTMIRKGLRAQLESHPGWEICGEALTGRQAVELALQYKPNLVILDFTMPELNGCEAARRICQALPQTEILMLTVHESETVVHEAFAAGAKGFLCKTDSSVLLISAVEALSRHEAFVSPEVSQYVLDGFLGKHPPAAPAESGMEALTAREREILQLIAEGRSNKEMAGLLNLSIKTIETHRANLMAKMNFHSISELVRFAVRTHLIEP